eukprot:1151961-Pyramimonas_sp.AAC.1
MANPESRPQTQEYETGHDVAFVHYTSDQLCSRTRVRSELFPGSRANCCALKVYCCPGSAPARDRVGDITLVDTRFAV